MIYETVVNEIKRVRSEEGLPELSIDASTSLDDLGFDSLSYTVLMARLEAKLKPASWDPAADNMMLPSVVADLMRMFEMPAHGDDKSQTALVQ